MKKEILSIIELKALLETEEYKYESPERMYIQKFEKNNKWTTQEVLELFDTLTVDGKPPTPDRYFEEGMRLTKEYWFLDSDKGVLASSYWEYGYLQYTYIPWSKDIEKAVLWRLSKMYESMMAEYSAVCILNGLFANAHILTSSELDLVLGVDIAVMSKTKQGRNFLVHVTKNSKWAMDNINNKAQKKGWLPEIDNKRRKHYWQRRFTDSHVIFLYDRFESDTTEIVNGHSIFRYDYVRGICKELCKTQLDIFDVDSDEPTGELAEFHNFLKNNNIVYDGIWSMIINKDIT